LDSKTLKPIPGAKIIIDKDSFFTDENGEFYADSLVSGPTILRIIKDGYKELSKVIILYEGYNYRRLLITKKYVPKPMKPLISKEKIKEKIKKCDEKSKIEDDTSYLWNSSYYQSEVNKEKSKKRDKNVDLKDIINIVNRVEGKIKLIGKVLEKDKGYPLADIPVIINDEIVFTDENGKFEYDTVKDYADILINCKNIEKVEKKIKLENTKNYVEILCKVEEE
jgi:hypothetical protein